MANFPPIVERWRPYFARELPDWPGDFVLAWIEMESGGKPNAQSRLDERGLSQISPDARVTIGMSSADWAYLLTPESSSSFDPNRNVALAALSMRYIRKQADRWRAKYGINWSGHDYWASVKLYHGLPVILRDGWGAYVTAHGGSAPPTWADMAGWLRSTGWSYGGFTATRISQILGNAERAARFLPASLGQTMIILALVGAVALAWYKWR